MEANLEICLLVFTERVEVEAWDIVAALSSLVVGFCKPTTESLATLNLGSLWDRDRHSRIPRESESALDDASRSLYPTVEGSSKVRRTDNERPMRS